MTTEAKNKGGRPAKAPEDRRIVKSFRLPQDLAIEFERAVVDGGRSEFVERALRRELAKLQRKAG